MYNKKILLIALRYIQYLLLIPFIVISLNAHSSEMFSTEEFKFKSEGRYLSGLISRPINVEAKSLVIIVHGSGATDVVEQDGYYDIRKKFTSLGISVAVWDKPGCGSSEGEFDPDQPVESSANEVVAAAQALREKNVSGSKIIGLWGISRAGWIAPLAINKDSSIDFWISVSGTDALENWGYLLKSHLALDGYSQSEVDALYVEWNKGNEVYRTGGSYSEYMRVTKSLRQNSMYQRLTGQEYKEYQKGGEEYERDRMEYISYQKSFMAERHEFDSETGLRVYVPNFDKVLANVEIPVLAIFGGNDRNVDWKKTKALYEGTIGKNNKSSLEVKVFPDADHNIRMSKYGSIFESQKQDYWKVPYADGYYKAMADWLCSNNFCQTEK